MTMKCKSGDLYIEGKHEGKVKSISISTDKKFTNLKTLVLSKNKKIITMKICLKKTTWQRLKEWYKGTIALILTRIIKELCRGANSFVKDLRPIFSSAIAGLKDFLAGLFVIIIGCAMFVVFILYTLLFGWLRRSWHERVKRL